MATREEAKEQTRRRILGAARRRMAERGAAALNLREVARDAGLVPSAVYRHFEGRDALITQLLVDSYEQLADHLESTPLGAEPWRARTSALRAWATTHPHDLALLYGTPVPGYTAPPDTVPAAGRVAAALLAAAPPGGPGVGPVSEELRAQLADSAAAFGVEADVLARTLAAISQLMGILLLEAGGHFVGTADPADLLWEQAVTSHGSSGPEASHHDTA